MVTYYNRCMSMEIDILNSFLNQKKNLWKALKTAARYIQAEYIEKLKWFKE